MVAHPGICKLYVKHDWKFYPLIPSRYRTDKHLISEMLGDADYRAFNYMDRIHLSDRDFIIELITKNGMILSLLDSSYNGVRNIVLAAVIQNGRVLSIVKRQFKNDPQVWSYAMSQNFESHVFIPKRAKQTSDFLTVAMKYAPSVKDFEYATRYTPKKFNIIRSKYLESLSIETCIKYNKHVLMTFLLFSKQSNKQNVLSMLNYHGFKYAIQFKRKIADFAGLLYGNLVKDIYDAACKFKYF